MLKEISIPDKWYEDMTTSACAVDKVVWNPTFEIFTEVYQLVKNFISIKI
jgi:hypothetical protein